MKTTSILIPALTVATFLALSGITFASVEEIKLYKEAYPGSKPKCIDCHTAAIPKKDGDHELNEYGKKIKSLDEKPTVETYKKAGSIEDFANSK